MADLFPAWQTDELGEEWVEASPTPSPPGSPLAEAAATPTQASIHAKRGSLRSLGHSAARGLPSSRRTSANAPEFARSPSNPYVRSASGMLSPPTSASSHSDDGERHERNHKRAADEVDRQSANDENNDPQAAGTFLVKDGEDSHGKAFPKNPFGRSDIFQRSKLERLFEPPSPNTTTTNQPEPIPEQPENIEESPLRESTSPTNEPTLPAPEVSTTGPRSASSSPRSVVSNTSSTPSASSQVPSSAESRRVSHPYAPVNPSRLCKSVTPSDSSFATTTEATTDTSLPVVPQDSLDGATVEYPDETDGALVLAKSASPEEHGWLADEPNGTANGEVAQDDYEQAPHHSDNDHDHDSAFDPTQDMSLTQTVGVISPERNEYGSGDSVDGASPLSNPNYPFTFSHPVPEHEHDDESPVFEPSLDPLSNGEPSHSTLRMRSVQSNLGRGLFRSAYDTATREHFTAFLDNLSPEHTPSEHTQLNHATNAREWSPPDSESPARSNERSDSMSTPTSGSSVSESRNFKRIRLSPPSPRGPVAVRDWRALGAGMMDRIRVTDPDLSITTDSRSASGTRSWASSRRSPSQTPFEGATGTTGYGGGPTFEYGTPATAWDAEQGQEYTEHYDEEHHEASYQEHYEDRYEGASDQSAGQLGTQAEQQASRNQQQYKSNPSTASSGYLREAEQVMQRLKDRKVSPSTSTTEASVHSRPRVMSTSSEQFGSVVSSEPEQSIPRASQTRSWCTTPELSVSEEKQRGQETVEEFFSKQVAVERPASTSPTRAPSQASGVSRRSVEGSGPPPSAPVNRDDLNRYISSSTAATATTTSVSFVKHGGPREPAKMTVIRPEDVQSIVTERVGRMRYDGATNRWIHAGYGSLGRVDEAGESRAGGSEESADVFAGFESLGSGQAFSSPEKGFSSPEKDAPAKAAVVRDYVVEMSAESIPEPSEADAGSVVGDSDHENNEEKQETPISPPVDRRLLRSQASSAPPVLLTTPTPATPGTPNGTIGRGPNPLRSALRNPNLTPGSNVKKTAAWHPDLTPQPARQGSAVPSSSSFKRSVSFSDTYVSKHVEETATFIKRPQHQRRPSTESDLFSESGTEGPNNGTSGWIASARTRRIQGVLDGMAELNIEEGSPSKPARERSTRDRDDDVRPQQPDTLPTPQESEEDSDDTMPIPARSFRSFRSTRSRGGANATFLTECSFGVAHDRLVQLITDVQPFEPYWEQLRTIDLSSKGVDSLARLKEFLPMLDEAKLNDNEIDYLSGIPSSVRTLHVAGNRLSSLTSVNHLRNLQYLDISRNQLDSVNQLECLRHLRELNADNNNITDLTGILSMDCLIKLSVSGNQIERVDLNHAKWERLESLNLSNNRIQTVRGLHRLKSIASINFDKNRLEALDPATPMTSVRILRVSDNDLSHLDLSHFPKVRTLFADNNALPGLSRSLSSGGHRMENLSLRSQRVQRFTLLPEDLQVVKRLYISGNRLDGDFIPPPSSPLYSLVYLEAVACNLAVWPSDFAARVPNLRILNVNYNFLPDLDGLRGLSRLRKLQVVGNRLGASGAGGAARGLRGHVALEEADLRMNPATLSFYLPILGTAKPSKHTHHGGSGSRIQAIEPDAKWAALDAQFRRQLPDEWYSKRLVYRGLVMAACPELRMLDGVEVREAERRKAAKLLEYASARV